MKTVESENRKKKTNENGKKPHSFSVRFFWGCITGAVNGLFGAGGGMIAVPLLKKLGMDQKEAHTNAVAVILPITAVSAVVYCLNKTVTVKAALPFIPTGLIGAVIGTLVIKKISPLALKTVFGGFMVYAGIRLLLR